MENHQRPDVQFQSRNLKPEWVSGFVDGEGCFFVGINTHPEMSAGYQVLPEFTVVQHKRDIGILYALKAFFGCGVIRTNHAARMAYRVRGVAHLSERILPFFEKYPLKTKKGIDFLKFRKIVLMMKDRQHLTSEGIKSMQSLASQMNRGKEKIESTP